MPRWNSAIGLFLSVLFGALLAFGLARNQANGGSKFLTTILCLIWLGSLYGIYAFGRQVFQPPLAMAVTHDGLITFARIDRADYRQPGFLIPWAEIGSFSYKTHLSTKRERIHAFHLRPGHAVMPVEKISLTTEQDVLYLEVWSEAIGKRILNDLLRFLT